MADDLADRLDDLICTFDTVTESDYGTLLLLLVGWVIAGFSIAFLNHFIHGPGLKFGRKKDSATVDQISSCNEDAVTNDINKNTAKVVVAENVSTNGFNYDETLTNGKLETQMFVKNVGEFEIPPFSKIERYTQPIEEHLPNKNIEIHKSTPDMIYDVPIRPPKLVPPEIRVFKEHVPTLCGIVIPKSMGSDEEASKWVNQCFENTLRNANVREIILEQWRKALVDYNHHSSDEESFKLDVIGIDQINSPLLSNVMTKSHPHDNMTVTADLEASFSVHMRIRFMGSAMENTVIQNSPPNQWDWLLLVQELKGRISLAILSRERLIIVKLEGWPEVNSRLAMPMNEINSSKNEIEYIGQKAHDMMMMAIRSSQITINMEDFGHHIFPVYKKVPKRLKSALKSSEDYEDRFRTPRSRSVSLGAKLKQINVHISKAREFGINCRNPYVVVEMDEPNQSFTSPIGIVVEQGEVSFEYDCTFNLNTRSAEILFEVWGSVFEENEKKQVLGLGIVSLEELLIATKQTQVIPLQGGPFDDFSWPLNGLLTVEFNVVKSDGAEVKESEFVHRNGFEELKSQPGLKFEETTSVEKRGAPNSDEETLLKIGATKTPLRCRGHQGQYFTMPEKTSSFSLTRLRKESASGGIIARPNLNPSDSVAISSKGTSPIMSRGRRIGKKSLIKSFRHRLSATTRSFSLEQHLCKDHEKTSSPGNGSSPKTEYKQRSISSDRRRSLTELRTGEHPRRYRTNIKHHGHRQDNSELRSPPPPPTTTSSCSSYSSSSSSLCSISDSMSECSLTLGSWKGAFSGSWQSASILNVPNFGDDGSSQSDLSGISNVSNRTYLNEESSLILEFTENGIKRAYFVPYEVAKQGKLRRKGVKLHVYMDHIFVAKHVKGGTICEVCQSGIPIRLGKQGYVCRDCSLVCHKTCHVRVENHCTETSLPAMEIECYNDSEDLRLNHQDDYNNGQAPV